MSRYSVSHVKNSVKNSEQYTVQYSVKNIIGDQDADQFVSVISASTVLMRHVNAMTWPGGQAE